MTERNDSCLSKGSKCLGGGAAWIESDIKGLFDKLLLGVEIIYFEHSFIHSTSIYEALTICGSVLGVRDVISCNTELHLPSRCLQPGRKADSVQRDRAYSTVVDPFLSSLFHLEDDRKKSRLVNMVY